MSDNNFRDYDLDNFDDKMSSGKHFRGEGDALSGDYDLDTFKSDENNTVSDEAKASQPDYGDDFYAGTDSFEPSEEEDFQPVITRKSYSRTVVLPDKNKKKNIAIIVLSITLALVVFVFSLILFLNSSDKKDNKKPTVASTVATETVTKTEPTEEKTEAPTEKQTEAPTQAPTQAYEEPTDAPVEEPTEYYEEPTFEEITDDVEPTRVVIS